MSAGLPAASAIVLAGGRSTRFGRDKLREPLAGRPLLHHAVLAVAGVCAEVLVVGGPDDALPDAPGVAIGRLPDEQPFAGPLVALGGALAVVREPLALVVAGDMPMLVGAVLGALLRTLDGTDGIDACALEYRGRRQPLPVALRVGAASSTARTSIARGERSLTALLSALRVRDLDEGQWRALDPAAATLRDVDRPEDLRA